MDGAPSSTLADAWPLFGLRITAGPLELRPVSDPDIPVLADLAGAGIHAPESMPFLFPWTDAAPDALARTMAAYYWRTRAELRPARWTVDFVARWDGEVVGVQGFKTEAYRVTRSGETGSWLGRTHQGRGIGTFMRRTLCAFVFDHLDAEEVTSGAFEDNPASLAVSTKVGYTPNGRFRRERRPDELATLQALRLTPAQLVRHDHDLHVEALEPARRLLGL